MDKCERKLLLNLTISSRAVWSVYKTPGHTRSKMDFKCQIKSLNCIKSKGKQTYFSFILVDIVESVIFVYGCLPFQMFCKRHMNF